MVLTQTRMLLAVGTISAVLQTTPAAEGPPPRTIALQSTVDLDIGQSADVELCDGSLVRVKVVELEERRDDLRQAVREARVTVEVDGVSATLTSANYNLPQRLGGVQIDCPVTRGCVQPDKNPWALDADVRLRLWPADSPWIRPETFGYPVRQRWFASDTQMSNEPTFVDGGEDPARKSIYYHWGLDFGGAEALVEVIAATDGIVCSSGTETLESVPEDSPVRPRYDVIYVRDDRGWYYRYSHLHSIDKAIRPGNRIRKGQTLGRLGKEGGSGGWSHLHFDINAIQPSGRYGIVEAYAFAWQAYQAEHPTPLKAVARPHHLVWTGQPVTLDGTRSTGGSTRAYEWTFCDGTTADGARVVRRYDNSGEYSVVLKVSDAAGRVDYDFARVLVIDREHPDQLPPAIHAAYFPTFGIRPGDPVTFKVRSFRIAADEGQETWDFGDGSDPVQTRSDGNANVHDPQGYAVTTHTYQRPGHYVVRVQRTNDRGQTAIGHVQVRVLE